MATYPKFQYFWEGTGGREGEEWEVGSRKGGKGKGERDERRREVGKGRE